MTTFSELPIPFEMYLASGGQDLSQLSGVDVLVDVETDTDVRRSADGGENSVGEMSKDVNASARDEDDLEVHLSL
jgi:hypothetical protein